MRSHGYVCQKSQDDDAIVCQSCEGACEPCAAFPTYDWHARSLTRLASCEFDRHVGMLYRHAIIILLLRQTHRHDIIILLLRQTHRHDISACYHHLVTSTDTSACYHHLAVILLCIRQTHLRATIILLSSCVLHRHAVYRHIGMLLSFCCHLVYSTDTSACYHHLVTRPRNPRL
jgi:hypothetical protein